MARWNRAPVRPARLRAPLSPAPDRLFERDGTGGEVSGTGTACERSVARRVHYDKGEADCARGVEGFRRPAFPRRQGRVSPSPFVTPCRPGAHVRALFAQGARPEDPRGRPAGPCPATPSSPPDPRKFPGALPDPVRGPPSHIYNPHFGTDIPMIREISHRGDPQEYIRPEADARKSVRLILGAHLVRSWCRFSLRYQSVCRCDRSGPPGRAAIMEFMDSDFAPPAPGPFALREKRGVGGTIGRLPEEASVRRRGSGEIRDNSNWEIRF